MNPPPVGKLRLKKNRLLQLSAPGFGTCYRCEVPWKFTTPHTTQYTRNRGCFPLCERCWIELETPENRLPYYDMLIRSWILMAPVAGGEGEAIMNAVLKGG